MSNNDNIYNILNNFNKIAKDAPAPAAATPKAKTKLQESMEQVVNEKYMGFKKTVAAVKKGGSAEDPEAVAAAIGRKKYGKEKLQKAAATGKKLNEKAVNPYAVGMAVAKKKAGITAKPAHDLPKKVIKKAHEIAKKIDEAQSATTYTVAYKDSNNPKKSNSTQVKATSAAEAKAAFEEWNSDNTPGRFVYLGSRPDVDTVYEDSDLDEGFDDMIKDVNRKAKEKGTGKFDKKEISTGTVYTRKYNPKSGETDDTENVSAEKRGRGRPKKSAFEATGTIDKMIAESFGELFEGTWRPVGDPVSKSAPAPAVGSGIRVTPMPALATPAKPAAGQGSIQGGVWTATPPKAGTPGVPVPQGLDEVDAEMEDMRKMAGLKGGQKKLDRDHDGKLTAKDFSMLRKGLEEETDGNSLYSSALQKHPKLQQMDRAVVLNALDDARESYLMHYGHEGIGPDEEQSMIDYAVKGLVKPQSVEEGDRDDMEEHIDKVQWLMGAPNYLSRDEAEETAYYNTDPTAPVWAGYRDDADEIEENLIVVPNPSGASSAADAKKLGAMMPSKPGEKDPISTNEDDMEEGNAFSGAVAKAKADGIQPGETISVGGKEYDLKEGDAALNQMRRIAGLKECGMSPFSGMASDMEKQQGNMNISTNQNSDGTKSVTITANGDAAGDLMQMLKLAGMDGASAATEPEIVVIAQDGEETMEEEKDPRYQASTTPDEQVAPVQALTKGGNGDVAGQEKKMKPGGYQFGDNNLAMQESLSAQLMKEYNSIKIKK